MSKEDFDKADSGRYRETPHRQTIIESLNEHHYQSFNLLVKNTGLKPDEISDVLKNVWVDDVLTAQFVGSIEVYFLRKNPPTGKLYNSGDGEFLDNARLKKK